MYIWHDDNEFALRSPEELRPVVDSLMTDQCGAIILGADQSDYPMIHAFVAGPFGYLYYFPNEETAGYVATGMAPEDCPDIVHFQWGRQPSGNDIEVPKSLVIPADVAGEALFEFLVDGCRPKSVEWFEL